METINGDKNKGENMDRIYEIKKILERYNHYRASGAIAKEIDALYSTVDGDLREKIAEYLTKQFIGEPKNFPKDECLSEADSILQMIAEAGYVKLDNNQELPPIPSFTYDKQADIPLLKRGAINYSKLLSGWRKTDES